MTDLRHIPLEELEAEVARRKAIELIKQRRERSEEEDYEAIIADRINKTFEKPSIV